MYPRNAASPPPMAIGAVVQISDGAVQTTGVSARVKTGTGSWATAANSPTCDTTSGIWEYTPSQGETNAASFQVALYKTGCIPVAQTVVTSASDVAGYAGVDWSKLNAPTTTQGLTGTTISTSQAVASVSGAVGSVTGNVGGNVAGSVASVTGAVGSVTTAVTLPSIPENWITASGINAAALNGKGDWNVGKTGYALTATTGLGNQTANITGNLSGSVGSVTAVSAGAITSASFEAGAINAAAIATAAITSGGVATTAVTEIAQGVRAELATELARIDAATSTRATQTSVDTVAGYLDTEVAAIKAKTDNLPASPAATGDIPSAGAIADAVWDEAQSGHTSAGTFGLYLDAKVSEAGGSSLTVGDIADAVWDEAISGHLTAGSTGNALNAAGSAGDPWSTPLPGAYGSGTAGKIIGDRLDATVGSRATQTSVDTIDGIVDDILVDTAVIGAAGAGLTAIPWNAAWDAEVQSEAADALAAYDPPTHAELTSGLAAADDAVLAVLGTPAGASLAADVAAVKAQTGAIETDTQDVQARLPATLVSGRMDASVGAMAANVMTAAAAAADLTTELQAGLATASDLATVAGYIDTEVAAILAAVDTEVAAIKAKTDNLPAAPAATGDIPTASAIADAVLDEAVEGSVTLRESVRLANAALGGKASGLDTTNPKYRDLADTKDRIDATVDGSGNRSAVTRDLT